MIVPVSPDPTNHIGQCWGSLGAIYCWSQARAAVAENDCQRLSIQHSLCAYLLTITRLGVAVSSTHPPCLEAALFWMRLIGLGALFGVDRERIEGNQFHSMCDLAPIRTRLPNWIDSWLHIEWFVRHGHLEVWLSIVASQRKMLCTLQLSIALYDVQSVLFVLFLF